MSKKWKGILAVVGVVAAISLLGGGVVLAAGERAQNTAQSNPLLSKVATILGVTEQKLTDAFQQARTQYENEKLDQWLAKAVENKTITQEEATKIRVWWALRPNPATKESLKAWYDQKPQLAKKNALKGFLEAPGRVKMHDYSVGGLGIGNADILAKVAVILGIPEQTLKDAFTQAGKQLRAEGFDKALANAVTNGKITQTESDQIKTWWAQKPAALDKLAPGLGIKGAGRFGKGGMMRGSLSNRGQD